jgi:pimeloyl-ACP methyl ester carboxylesterase
MAYMDVPPGSESNGKTVVLMHGKAFGGYYFEHVIEASTAAGCRVVVPDQIGWGKSSKPDIHYSFQLLAANTAALPRWARAAALTFQMIYQQPVRYEYHLIAPPTLLIVGAEDHVVPLGQYAQPEDLARLGDFIGLSEAAARDIPNAKRVVIPECGHIPHIEHPAQFLDAFLPFLAS